MSYLKPLLKSVLLVVVVTLVLAVVGSVLAQEKTLRFDCGTVSSPLMAGFQRLTADDLYDQAKGYGWESQGAASVEFQNPGPLNPFWRPREQTFDENLTALNCDAVVSEQDLIFRADVPPGIYRVTVTLGDMSKAVGSMEVYVNDKLVGEHAAAWTPGGYRILLQAPYGWWNYVRTTYSHVEATGRPATGFIRIRVTKNQTYYDQQMAEQMTWNNPFGVWWQEAKGQKTPPYFYIGWPFVHNSVMAIEIAPDLPAPVVAEGDKLRLTRDLNSPKLRDAVSLFNERDFAGALSASQQIEEPQAQAARALIQLWLAGRLEVEKEAELVPQALEVLRQDSKAHPDEAQVAEALQDAEIFQKAYELFIDRGKLGRNGYIEIDKAIGWWLLIQEDSPLFYKSQLYVARAGHMLTPYVPTLGMPEQILKKLEAKFPDNRQVKYRLHWEWQPYGDGTHPEDWRMEDYAAKVQGAPEWVQALYPAFGDLVDWAEWFIKFRQQPEGSIGGGLSDDVEMVGVFGYVGFISRGISDLLLQGARKLCEANWQFGEIDDEIGFYLPFADAEHVAEPTGNTLDMMVTIDYGNPLWIERSMKTGKLIRDLWTGLNDQGYRHFRANFFNADRVGGGDLANDSWINYRAVSPAWAVLWYNDDPAMSKLFVELADGWLASGMSTDRGKPAGVIPAQVAFPEGILGGTNSPNWYTASHPSGTVNYDWPGQEYKDFMQSLFITAYEQTRDAKYLEPLRLEYELAAKYGRAPAETTRRRLGGLIHMGISGTEIVYSRWPDLLARAPREKGAPQPAPTAPVSTAPVEKGSEEWVARTLKGVEAWLRAKYIMEGRKGELEDDLSKDDVLRHGKFVDAMFKLRWPLMTTEAHATDRAAFAGVINPFFIYTGGRASGRSIRPSITYDNTTKDFAAAVMATDRQGFRIMYYSLAPDTRQIGIVPWELEPGGKYKLTYGPDLNGDEEMDSVAESKEFIYRQRGTPVYISVQPRTTYMIEAEQLERGKGFIVLPDPGVSPDDIRYIQLRHTGTLMARIHNVGAKDVQNVKVAFYDGDPDAGGILIATSVAYNLMAPVELESRPSTIGIDWNPSKGPHDIYVVIDPAGELEEITTFNNKAHAMLPKNKQEEEPKKQVPESAFGSGGRR